MIRIFKKFYYYTPVMDFRVWPGDKVNKFRKAHLRLTSTQKGPDEQVKSEMYVNCSLR